MSSYDDELDQLRELKCEDSYHFTKEFEYIVGHEGDDDGCTVDVATMEIDITWNDSVAGYEASWYVPSADYIDPDEGNDLEEIADMLLIEVAEELAYMGVSRETFAFE